MNDPPASPASTRKGSMVLEVEGLDDSPNGANEAENYPNRSPEGVGTRDDYPNNGAEEPFPNGSNEPFLNGAKETENSPDNTNPNREAPPHRRSRRLATVPAVQYYMDEDLVSFTAKKKKDTVTMDLVKGDSPPDIVVEDLTSEGDDVSQDRHDYEDSTEYIHKRSGTFRVGFKLNKKMRYFGTYPTWQEAIRARDVAQLAMKDSFGKSKQEIVQDVNRAKQAAKQAAKEVQGGTAVSTSPTDDKTTGRETTSAALMDVGQAVSAMEGDEGDDDVSKESRDYEALDSETRRFIYVNESGNYTVAFNKNKKKRTFGSFQELAVAMRVRDMAVSAMQDTDKKTEQEIVQDVVRLRQAASAMEGGGTSTKSTSRNKRTKEGEEPLTDVGLAEAPVNQARLKDKGGTYNPKDLRNIEKRSNGYAVRIVVRGEKVNFGTFPTVEAAQRAREAARFHIQDSQNKSKEEAKQDVERATQAVLEAAKEEPADGMMQVAAFTPPKETEAAATTTVALPEMDFLSDKEINEKLKNIYVMGPGKWKIQFCLGSQAVLFLTEASLEGAMLARDAALLETKGPLKTGHREKDIKRAKEKIATIASENKEEKPEFAALYQGALRLRCSQLPPYYKKMLAETGKLVPPPDKKRKKNERKSDKASAKKKLSTWTPRDEEHEVAGDKKRTRRSKRTPRNEENEATGDKKRTRRSTRTPGAVDYGSDANLRPKPPPNIHDFTRGLPTQPASEFYVEESAWRFHNPPLPPGETEVTKEILQALSPLPDPPGLPEFPNTGHCVWTWNKETRVLHADFRKETGNVCVSPEDERFLLKMMERDDITVISEGLACDLNKELWNPEYIADTAGHEYYHKYRRFQKRMVETNGSGQGGQSADDGGCCAEYDELDKCVSMKISDYFRYLEKRKDALEAGSNGIAGTNPAPTSFTFTDDQGMEHDIDVVNVVLYMIDLDMVKLLPSLYEDFCSSFKLPGCTPGGGHCMMNHVNSGGRPFMGPNLYVTPPASFTHFHQDGHGTVDSGHLCLTGCNEVVMMRRLTEVHKRNALFLLNGSDKKYDALYGLPHGDGMGEKPMWPSCEAIEKCEKMGYCPSVFILKRGQLVHINKGRLHAFRKLAPVELPKTDCHAKLRGAEIHRKGYHAKEEICVSVAWDWMYRGVSAEGINREIVSTLECAVLNRKHNKQSLAIPELSIMQMARALTSRKVKRNSWLGFAENLGKPPSSSCPPTETVLKGILPSLRYVVGKHEDAERNAETQAKKANQRDIIGRVSIATKPNSWENPDVFELDPYGDSDFFCKFCFSELSNVYMHCDGCEKLLHKDFNICVDCHKERKYAVVVRMHPLNDKRHSTMNHTGNMTYDRGSRCPCKNGPVCKNCKYCSGCSCRCHQCFTLNRRFLSADDSNGLLKKVEEQVGFFPAEETMARLKWIGACGGSTNNSTDDGDNTVQDESESGAAVEQLEATVAVSSKDGASVVVAAVERLENGVIVSEDNTSVTEAAIEPLENGVAESKGDALMAEQGAM